MTHDPDCVMNFLETGSLGPLHLGMIRQQIIDNIGEPDDFGYARKRDPQNNCVLLYGTPDKVNLQLPISDGKLTGIWLYFRGSDDMSSLPQWMTPETCPLRGSIRLNDFFSFADRTKLPWRFYYPLTMEDQTTLILSLTKIHLIWGHDPDEMNAAMLTK